MATLKTEILVLRTRRFSESSLVATLLSREHGRLDVLAKGCRREKSPLFGHLDLYQREDALIIERPAASLDLLVEAGFVNEHTGLRFHPAAFAAAGLLADFAAEAVLPGEPQKELFDVLAGSFAVLSDLGNPAHRAGLSEAPLFDPGEKAVLIGRTLKLALLDMLGWLGFGLELRRCLICGRPPEVGRPAGLSRRHGGLICSSCRSRVADAVVIKPMALASLRRRRDGTDESETPLPRGEQRRWLRFLIDYAEHAIEKPLRGKRVLFQMF